jgi:hypothetical protein
LTYQEFNVNFSRLSVVETMFNIMWNALSDFTAGPGVCEQWGRRFARHIAESFGKFTPFGTSNEYPKTKFQLKCRGDLLVPQTQYDLHYLGGRWKTFSAAGIRLGSA